MDDIDSQILLMIAYILDRSSSAPAPEMAMAMTIGNDTGNYNDMVGSHDKSSPLPHVAPSSSPSPLPSPSYGTIATGVTFINDSLV